MSVYELVMTRRTTRRFQQKPVPEDLINRLIDAGRMAPSGGNLQPLEFIAVNDPQRCAAVFAHTAWAGYLPNWEPAEGERPTAYIVILHNQQISANAGQDPGIAAESLTLTAWDEGVASCMIGSLNRPGLSEVLGLPDNYEVSLVVALGYPAEVAVAEEATNADIKYWRDEQGVHYVPKRPRSQVVHWDHFGGCKA